MADEFFELGNQIGKVLTQRVIDKVRRARAKGPELSSLAFVKKTSLLLAKSMSETIRVEDSELVVSMRPLKKALEKLDPKE